MDVLFQDSILILGVLGVLAFITNIIVEMTKDLDPIKKMPTKLYAIIVSAFVNLVSLIICCEYKEMKVTISSVILALLASFIVAFISTYGWESCDELKDRFIKGE